MAEEGRERKAKKIAEIDTDDLPIWMCAVVDSVSENCKKRLKTSPQYSRIVEESDKLLFQYPFISTLIDRDKIETPMNLTLEQTKALSRFLALDADREDYERIQLVSHGMSAYHRNAATTGTFIGNSRLDCRKFQNWI